MDWLPAAGVVVFDDWYHCVLAEFEKTVVAAADSGSQPPFVGFGGFVERNGEWAQRLDLGVPGDLLDTHHDQSWLRFSSEMIDGGTGEQARTQDHRRW